MYGGIHGINSKKLLWIRVTNFPLLCPWPASNYWLFKMSRKDFSVKRFTCYKTSSVDKWWWDNSVWKFLGVRSSNIDGPRWYLIQVIDCKMICTASSLIDDNRCGIWPQAPVCGVCLDKTIQLNEFFKRISYSNCPTTHNVWSDVNVNLRNCCSGTRRE